MDNGEGSGSETGFKVPANRRKHSTNSKLSLIWLSILPGMGIKRKNELLKVFKSADDLWNANRNELRNFSTLSSYGGHDYACGERHLLKNEQIDIMLDESFKNEASKIFRLTQDSGIDVAGICEDDYPRYLKCISDPPLVLYYKGKLIADEMCVAVVGSRRATSYGLRMADRIAEDLSLAGITVVSGMARGIDSASHNAALRNDNRTLGIMGCGLDIIYPPENARLMAEIISKGAAISEFPPGTPPLAHNFPLRNRIISGISVGVVIVEANEKSGSLITANCALDQGRDVYAVPGNIVSRNSFGANKLIKDGAKIVTGVDDILEELRFCNLVDRDNERIFEKTAQSALLRSLDGEEKKIVAELELESLHIDMIAQKTGLPAQTVAACLLMLEMKGVVRQEQGKIFEMAI